MSEQLRIEIILVCNRNYLIDLYFFLAKFFLYFNPQFFVLDINSFFYHVTSIHRYNIAFVTFDTPCIQSLFQYLNM